MQGAGPALGSVFGGLVANATTEWRWVFWMTAVPSGLCMLLVIACIPETNFKRPVADNTAGMTPSAFAELRRTLNLSHGAALSVNGWYDRYADTKSCFLARNFSDGLKGNITMDFFHTTNPPPTSPGSSLCFCELRPHTGLGSHSGYSQFDSFHRNIWLFRPRRRQHQHLGVSLA